MRFPKFEITFKNNGKLKKNCFWDDRKQAHIIEWRLKVAWRSKILLNDRF